MTRAALEPIVGRYLRVPILGEECRVYFEEAGQGIPLVCLHTAGADSRQFRHLMCDEAVTRHYRVIAFDLPWHGKSYPPPGWEGYINWVLRSTIGISIPWLSEPFWARFSVIVVNIWYGSPFFMIMYLAGLKSVSAELYESATMDGANAFQRLLYVTIPMMRNIIAITVLFSTIVTFANFDIVRVLTYGGPRNTTDLFGTWAFKLGIGSGDIPLGAAVSLFLFPLLAILAIFILRDISRRTREI